MEVFSKWFGRNFEKGWKTYDQCGLASLEEKGYLVRRQLKSEDGKFKGYEWDIFEEPQVKVPIADFQKTDNLTTEKRSSDNLTQSNTNKDITYKFNMNQSSEEEIYRNKWKYGLVEKQTSEKSFWDICKQVEGYGKPIGNLRAFVKRCLKNYFEGNIIRYSPKRKSFNDFQQNEYDFEELERAILSN